MIVINTGLKSHNKQKDGTMYMYKKLLGITGVVLLSTSMNLNAAEDVTAAVAESGKKTQAQAGVSAKE
ncbi:MAG: hypothetical protein DRQ78_12410, partial [Epsilonproteobacteria bacterium]